MYRIAARPSFTVILLVAAAFAAIVPLVALGAQPLLTIAIQDVPPLPAEVTALWLGVVGSIGSALFGLATMLSAKINALPPVVKGVIGLVGGFFWAYAVKFAATIGIPLPDEMGQVVATSGPILLATASAIGMGLRAFLKAIGWSRFLDQLAASRA